MDEERREEIEDIVTDLNKDVELPPYDNKGKRGYSKNYRDYKEAEKEEKQKTRFERFCIKSGGILNLKAGEKTNEKLSPPLKLLDWDITPGMVLSAAVLTGFLLFIAWFFGFMINLFTGFLPTTLMFISLFGPVAGMAYVYYNPIYEARNKVIQSSGDMILSILYMVVYMRSSPNLEGAIRFAALNLKGPVSEDLKGILWDVEIGNYERVEEALDDYTKAWKEYNQDYLESLQLLKASKAEANPDRRERMLQDAIDTILEGTKEKMKHYARSLKMPVMILNAMGAMLPVLVLIMLPMISLFMGDVIRPLHLILLFNILLPGFLYWFMKRILSSRPPTVTFEPSNTDVIPERGRIKKQVFGKKLNLPIWPLGILIFLVIGSYGIIGYLSFPVFFPADINTAQAPSFFVDSEGGLESLRMLMRSVSLIVGAGLGIGLVKLLGNRNRKRFEDDLREIESQFPTALFELGNKISGGTPIELALRQAAQSTSDMEISSLFEKSSQNIERVGMDFEDALFDKNYGAIHQYPSQMIETVMKAILESSKKGTSTASMAMMTISRYLDSLHETKENLNDLMEETTTTIQMLAYLLAPVISGVAVGMSQTIINAMFQLSESFNEALGGDMPQDDFGAGQDFGGILGNVEAAISPELLQLVVGVYLIQLLWILGTFFVKITHGDDQTIQNIFIGKIMISGTIFYTLTLLIISMLFGGMISGIGI